MILVFLSQKLGFFKYFADTFEKNYQQLYIFILVIIN